MGRYFSLCLGLLIPLSLVIGQDQLLEKDSSLTTNLRIQVTNFREDQGGQLIVLLFKGEATWLESNQEYARTVRPVSHNMDLDYEFLGLSPSESYAVHVIHDKNENGKMDFQWLPPKPAEGIGVSNNIMRLGPPAYESAEIDLSVRDTRLTINLIY